MEAMSAITPAAHRGSVVHSRPFSLVVSPCLQIHLQNAMRFISDIFPVLEISYELSKFSMVVSGFALPLVYRPRLLLCGIKGVELDHLGPSILHELENFPVHALGLSSLLSDLSAKTPKETLVTSRPHMLQRTQEMQVGNFRVELPGLFRGRGNIQRLQEMLEPLENPRTN
ncbi:unnamed protein product [Lactuca saligna]|uniref:Uncharacterized protein n=1 Tax=Lactuca saligna TaxID=75948 RepID=A0AA36E5Q5_LACSI|nr:unnamed protein product [Lactuca saligna]